MSSKKKTPATLSTSPQTLKIGSRVRCTDDGVEGRIVWANAVAVKIQWDDGEHVTWRRDSLSGRPIAILGAAGDEDEHATTADSEQAVAEPALERATTASASAVQPSDSPAAEPTAMPEGAKVPAERSVSADAFAARPLDVHRAPRPLPNHRALQLGEAASTSEMVRFETETLSNTENLKHLIDLSGKWIDQAHRPRKLTKLILDMDSSVSETYGHQEGTAYNGYFACLCYHPLFRDIPKYFRGDSAFALPKLLRLLENEGVRYAIRLKSNPVLQRKIAHLLRRPVGRPSRKLKVFYHSFRYQADSWKYVRRVVAVRPWSVARADGGG